MSERVSGRSRGFVLLVVVVMLAITCLMLYEIAIVSFARVREVIQLERERREFWSVMSLRQSLLPLADGILTRRERSANLREKDAEAGYVPVTQAVGSMELNNLGIRITISDESSKLNIPEFLREWPQDCQRSIQILAQGSGLRLNDNRLSSQEDDRIRWWDDVFEHRALGVTSSLKPAIERLTLWGDGRLNIVRADEEVLHEAWQIVFGHFPPSELEKARQSFPIEPWPQIRDRLGLRDSQRRDADRFFTSTSSCFSLSLHLSFSASGGSDREWLFVRDRESGQYGFEL